MNLFLYVLLVSFSTCMAHYRRNYDTHNLLEREEPQSESDLVECPVCENSGNWMSSQENCPVRKGNKLYKRCEYGTYINEVCGNRLDCFRGPGDRCTEKMTFDMYGQRCAHGYYCNRALGVCTGLDYAVDSNVQWLINPNLRYPLRARRDV